MQKERLVETSTERDDGILKIDQRWSFFDVFVSSGDRQGVSPGFPYRVFISDHHFEEESESVGDGERWNGEDRRLVLFSYVRRDLIRFSLPAARGFERTRQRTELACPLVILAFESMSEMLKTALGRETA